MAKVLNWTEKELRYLVKNWHKITNKEIGKNLGKTESAVRMKATKYINLDMMNNRHWSEYENELLQKLYGTMSIEELSNRMKRTPISIEKRIRLLEGTASVSVIHSYYSPTDVAGFLGVNRCTVQKYAKNGIIPMIKEGCKFLIKEEVFWEWLNDNLDKPQYKTINAEYELDSPDWYKELIGQKKRELRNSKVSAKWTSMDDALLWSEMMKGTNYRNIAEQLGRGLSSIYHRASYLSKKKMQNVS